MQRYEKMGRERREEKESEEEKKEEDCCHAEIDGEKPFKFVSHLGYSSNPIYFL